MEKTCRDCGKSFPKTNEFFDEKKSYYNNITLNRKVYYICLTPRSKKCNNIYRLSIQKLTYNKYHEKSRTPIFSHIKGTFFSSKQEPYYKGEFEEDENLKALLSILTWDLSESELDSYNLKQKCYSDFNRKKSLKKLLSLKISDFSDEELEFFNLPTLIK